jgi:hypothetical protein
MTATQTRALTAEADAPQLGELLVASAKNRRDCAAAQALTEEETLLARPQVRTALVVKQEGRMTARWEGLAGRQYTLGLEPAEVTFLGLVLSILGIGSVPIAAMEELDERRLEIILRAILRLTRNDRIAVDTRL